jgi:DAK2 domain fusion protein YloV
VKSGSLDGRLWARLVVVSGKYLEERKAFIDSLNVFPVPDGDTGTNMSLTMTSASKAIQQDEDGSIERAAKTVSHGALMGARGNSGVILSQLMAGFARAAEGKTELDARELAVALRTAVETAYQAVMNPVEGTILTVSREAARYAEEAADLPGSTLESVFEAAYRGALLALKKTPDMLPVLKQAGVVDAGGQGMVYILEGMLKVIKGEECAGDPGQHTAEEPERSPIQYQNDEILEYQYCTEFILKRKEEPLVLEDIRAFLADKGDCILVVGNADTGKIHIHTNSPGKVLDFCTSLGTLHEIQIHNMSEQSQEMQARARAVKRLGLVGVAVGAGLIEIFKSLGVDVVIEGGQTMNPSTRDFVEAVENILAEEVLILPNNSNVVLAAEQAAKAVAKPCRVVRTRSIPQGIAALMAFNAENGLEQNRQKMEDAGNQVVTLEVTYAVRDSSFNGHEIVKGQVIGLCNGELAFTGCEASQVVEGLVAQNLKEGHELVTIYYGEDVQELEAREMVERLSKLYPWVDFELHFGGQPLYYYLISLE